MKIEKVKKNAIKIVEGATGVKIVNVVSHVNVDEAKKDVVVIILMILRRRSKRIIEKIVSVINEEANLVKGDLKMIIVRMTMMKMITIVVQKNHEQAHV